MKEKLTLALIENFASKCYNDANCLYDGRNYPDSHIKMVVDIVKEHIGIFKIVADYENTLGAAYCHDLIEDAKQTHSTIKKVCGLDVADITLAVTDVPAENRLMKHLLTMHKTVKDYRAIVLKLCDILANASYSKKIGSSMYRIYVEEYPYRKAIFIKALRWYKDKLNMDEIDKLWRKLDETHKNKQ